MRWHGLRLRTSLNAFSPRLPMNRPSLTLSALLFASLLPLHAAEDLVTIEPKEKPGMLLNPGKGWSASGLAKWQPPEVLEVVGMGVIRFEWATIEPREGEFHWQPVDEALADWARLGKVCNIGIMCANTHSRQPGGYVTPPWVFEAGAHKTEMDLSPVHGTQGTSGHKVAPVFDDPVFLARLRHLVQAFGKRYDGDPRIAVLDIRTYGNWGEAHMSPFPVKDIAPAKFREHVQMHLDAFKTTQLCLSCNAHLGHYGPLKEVFDWAVKEKHIAPRRDGICGNSDGRETAVGYDIAPGVFELYDDYDHMKAFGWWDGHKDKGGQGFTLEECIENGKPTWVDLSRGGKTGLHMLQENRALIARLTNRIGYHFHLQRASFPSHTTGTMELDTAWLNQGTAPVYIPCAVALALFDDQGRHVATTWPDGMIPRRWMPGPATLNHTKATFTNVPPGTYRLALAITAKNGDPRPFIRLGTDLPQVDDWSVLGTITVAGR